MRPTRRGRHARDRSFPLQALAWFVALLPLLVAWAYADPFASRPDEAAQIVRAESLVRGELLGRPANPLHDPDAPIIPHVSGVDRPMTDDPNVFVRVPGILSNLEAQPFCYYAASAQAPHCPDPFEGPAHDVTMETHVGRYPPLYYVLTGWPTLIDSGPGGNAGARVASAVLNDVFLALALGLAGARRGVFATLGVLFAATPILFFYAASLNPNGLEMTVALSLWVALAELLPPRVGRGAGTEPVGRGGHDGGAGAEAVGRGATTLAGVSACLLSLTRGLSPLWLVAIVACAVVAAGPAATRSLLARRAVRWWSAAAAGSVAGSVAWTLYAHGLYELHLDVPPATSNATILHHAIEMEPAILRQMVAVFGVNSVRPPIVLACTWGALVAALALWAFRRSRLGPRVVLVALASTPVAVPLAVALVAGHRYGLIWQGRYTMPLTEGLPVLSGFAIASAMRERPGDTAGDPVPGSAVRRGVAVAAAAWGAMQVVSLWWDVRHYTVGSGSPLTALLRTSPLGLPVPVAWAAGGTLATFVMVIGATRALARGKATAHVGPHGSSPRPGMTATQTT